MIRIEKNKFIFVMTSILEISMLMLLYLGNWAFQVHEEKASKIDKIGLIGWIIFIVGLTAFALLN